MPVFLLGALGFLKRIPWQAWALLGALDCAAARKSASNPKMRCDQTDEQIDYLGQTIGTLTTAIHKQNDAVAAMGRKPSASRPKARKPLRRRRSARKALWLPHTSDRLFACWRAQAKPCEPSARH
jgi:hypothetical protein